MFRTSVYEKQKVKRHKTHLEKMYILGKEYSQNLKNAWKLSNENAKNQLSEE